MVPRRCSGVRVALCAGVRLVAVAALFAVGCTDSVDIEPYLDLEKADGEPAHLRLVHRLALDVEEPSDLVSVNGLLYAVSDSHGKIYAVTAAGNAHEFLDIKGDDLEAIGYVRNELVVGEESTGTIWHIDATGDRHDPIALPDARDSNSGLEGLVGTPGGHLFAIKEKDPARIYELDATGGVLRDERVDIARDLSAISYNPRDRRLYVLSDEDATLFRLTHDFRADRAWKLPVTNPEGLAFDGSSIYIVSDSEARIYTFAFE